MVELWSEAVRSIEPHVKPVHLDRWVRPIECVAIDDGRILLRAPNRNHKEWFQDNFLPPILKDLEARTHRTYSVEFELVEQDAPAPVITSGTTSTPVMPAPVRLASPPDLMARYTFDKFVVGPSNQFAHAAARMAAEAPASRFNPLFIFGGVGLGKTHLLHAVGHAIHEQHPDWNIVSVTCERFVTDFIASIHPRQPGGSSMEDFRTRFRKKPDVLLIDDIQFLSSKDSSQNEFFHTFNELHQDHKQIVITSDKLPQELPEIEERLRSRFTWGLITEIEAPDVGTRVAILKHKAEMEKVVLPDDVALYLGSHLKTNVRELEGVLLRLATQSSIQNVPITLELAKEALKKLIAVMPTGLSAEAIQREVCVYFNVKLNDLKGPRRHRSIAFPRMVGMYLTRKLTSMSYPEIGNRFGGKDHSTVISGVRKIERLIGEDPKVRSVVSTIESHLRQV